MQVFSEASPILSTGFTCRKAFLGLQSYRLELGEMLVDTFWFQSCCILFILDYMTGEVEAGICAFYPCSKKQSPGKLAGTAQMNFGKPEEKSCWWKSGNIRYKCSANIKHILIGATLLYVHNSLCFFKLAYVRCPAAEFLSSPPQFINLGATA